MSDRSWFFAARGQQQGPYSEAQFRGFIAGGSVNADTLVWTEGMSGWQRAGDIPGLLGSSSAPVVVPPSGAWPAGGQALSAEFGTWELFGRGLLMTLGDLLVIPSPWTKTGFFRWFVERLRIPQRPNIVFLGQPGDIWYAFVLLALSIYVSAYNNYTQFGGILAQALLWWFILRWLVTNLSPDGTQRPFTFTGGALAYIGWYVFLTISILSIIGWAWVIAAWAQWMCRHLQGSRRQLIFNGTGLEILWRTFFLMFAIAFVIPIPWAIAWYTRWGVSQFSLVERSA